MKVIFALVTLLTCAISAQNKKPNIIVIMADDMGYECLGANGCEDYKTPRLDAMAKSGVRFINAYANPLCTPSRVKIMTGMYNVRNYVAFGILDRKQKTFAHYLKEAGYKTCVAGKWQLGKEPDSAQHFGFDESFLWQHTRGARREGTMIDSRHVNPRFEKNGKPVDFDNGEFSSDLCVDFIDRFITKHKDSPFLAYYPMILPHCPFVPTPGTADFDPKSKGSPTYKGKAKYFANMVEHIDKMIGKLEDRLEELGLAQNTIIIFTCDNGTDKPVVTKWNGKQVKAGKGSMTDTGYRVPFIVKFPGKSKEGLVTEQPLDLSDILPTLCELAGIKPPHNIDGKSIIPLLRGEKREKDHVYIFYDRQKGDINKAHVMARTATHHLERKGKNGEYIFKNCETPFASKEIKKADRTEADNAAFFKLKSIIEKNDLLDDSALEKNK